MDNLPKESAGLNPTAEIQRNLVQHMLGPRGGLFALGCLLGAACMYYFMAATLIKQINESHTDQVTMLNEQIKQINESHTDQVTMLNSRIDKVEQESASIRSENQRIRAKLEDIALERVKKPITKKP